MAGEIGQYAEIIEDYVFKNDKYAMTNEESAIKKRGICLKKSVLSHGDKSRNSELPSDWFFIILFLSLWRNAEKYSIVESSNRSFPNTSPAVFAQFKLSFNLRNMCIMLCIEQRKYLGRYFPYGLTSLIVNREIEF